MFKVGDQVRVVVNLGDPMFDAAIGTIATIIKLGVGKGTYILDISTSNLPASVWHASELELAQPEPVINLYF